MTAPTPEQIEAGRLAYLDWARGKSNADDPNDPVWVRIWRAMDGMSKKPRDQEWKHDIQASKGVSECTKCGFNLETRFGQ